MVRIGRGGLRIVVLVSVASVVIGSACSSTGGSDPGTANPVVESSSPADVRQSARGSFVDEMCASNPGPDPTGTTWCGQDPDGTTATVAVMEVCGLFDAVDPDRTYNADALGGAAVERLISQTENLPATNAGDDARAEARAESMVIGVAKDNRNELCA